MKRYTHQFGPPTPDYKALAEKYIPRIRKIIKESINNERSSNQKRKSVSVNTKAMAD